MVPLDDDTWEVVFVASGMAHASIVVGRLETEGIPTTLKYEAVGAIYGLTLNGLGEVKVTVPSQYLLHAQEVLSRTFDEQDIDWER